MTPMPERLSTRDEVERITAAQAHVGVVRSQCDARHSPSPPTYVNCHRVQLVESR
jgi:hypothetical protein